MTNVDAQLVETITLILSTYLPGRTVNNVSELSGGLINSNVRVDFDSTHSPIVIRFYRDGSSVCRKEAALHKLLSSRIPIAHILHSQPDGLDSITSFSILEFVDAITFQQLKETGNRTAIRQACESIGQTLAEIGRIPFQQSGRLLAENDELILGDPYVEGDDPILQLLEQFLSSPISARRLGVTLSDRVQRFGWECADLIPSLDERPALVHSDFGNRNILVHEKNGRWQVAAVLDWEFAFSGSPLLDVGHFLRYERTNEPLREPHFSQAFVKHGGQLPENWREIVRVIDLTALVQCLTIENLPSEVESELIELISATVERRDICIS